MGDVKVEEGAQEVVNRLDISALEAPETEEEKAAREAEEKGSEEKKEEESKEEEKKELEGKLEDGKEEEKKVEEELKKAEEGDATVAEIAQLRSMLRELRNDNIRLQAMVDKHERVQKGDLGEEGKGVDPTEVEKYQEVMEAAKQRTPHFNDLLSLMEVNPKFEDVRSVCTTDNFEYIFENLASFRAERDGTSFQSEYMKLQMDVWSQPNPYSYMYGVIKDFHPAYKKVEEGKEVKKEEEKEEKKEEQKSADGKSAKEIVREKKPVEAPGSIADIGKGAPAQGGWTAERIDALPESQLHTVPKDIYQKYLMGELD